MFRRQKLVNAGYAEHVLLSHDISVKIHLTAFGGFGYAHLIENILPLLWDLGIEQKTTIAEENPQRLLAWSAPAS
jgi:phosphotriesterase-related protein